MSSRTGRRGGVGAALASTATVTGLVLGCGVVTGLVAARALGPDGRGELAAIVVWVSTLLYAGTLGVPEAVAYFAAAERAERDRVWIAGQTLAVALGLIITAAGWWLVPLVLSGHDATLRETGRWYMLLYVVPGFGSLSASAWLQGSGRIHAFNISRLAVPVVSAVGMLGIVAASRPSVSRLAAALLLGNAAGWCVAAAFWRPTKHPLARPSASLANRMLRYGLRVQVGSWANTASVRLDQLLLTIFAPAAALGQYVVAVTYANVLLTIPVSAGVVMLSHVTAAQGELEARACVERWYRRVLWMTLAAGIVLAAAGPLLIPALFGSAFEPSVPVALILALATVVLGMNAVLSTACRGLNRPDISSTSEVIGAVVTGGALAVLLPSYGLYGAAVASLLAYATSHAYMTRAVIRTLGIAGRSLWMPTRDDVDALQGAAAGARRRLQQWLTGRRTVTDQDL